MIIKELNGITEKRLNYLEVSLWDVKKAKEFATTKKYRQVIEELRLSNCLGLNVEFTKSRTRKNYTLKRAILTANANGILSINVSRTNLTRGKYSCTPEDKSRPLNFCSRQFAGTYFPVRISFFQRERKKFQISSAVERRSAAAKLRKR